jgi:hypothetical protein
MNDVTDLVSESVERLRRAGVQMEPGLDGDEVAQIEEAFGFRFGSEHRAFLSTALPIGKSWMDWRNDTETSLKERLDWPVDSVIFDVHNNDFWSASWGDRPEDSARAEERARGRLARVPKLVPIYSHRYLPADPAPLPNPVSRSTKPTSSTTATTSSTT